MFQRIAQRQTAQRIVVLLVAINLVIETTLLLADYGVIGSRSWRSLTYEYCAFWAGLLYNWRPNYSVQPWTMFLTYAFVHGGVAHAVGNMVVLFVLFRVLIRRISLSLFLIVYMVSAVGGGACFALLTKSAQPMVGASGALFGLIGAWQLLRRHIRRTAGRSLWPVWRTDFILVGANGLLWVLLDGALAWQTHLGGYIAGWLTLFLKEKLTRTP